MQTPHADALAFLVARGHLDRVPPFLMANAVLVEGAFYAGSKRKIGSQLSDSDAEMLPVGSMITRILPEPEERRSPLEQRIAYVRVDDGWHPITTWSERQSSQTGYGPLSRLRFSESTALSWILMTQGEGSAPSLWRTYMVLNWADEGYFQPRWIRHVKDWRRPGVRFQTSSGDHGTVARVERSFIQVVYDDLWSDSVYEDRYDQQVKPEVDPAPPFVLAPITTRPENPAGVFRALERNLSTLAQAKEKEKRALLPTKAKEWRQTGEDARKIAKTLLDRLIAWRMRMETARRAVPWWEAHRIRYAQIYLQDAPSVDEQNELIAIGRLPNDWRTLFVPGLHVKFRVPIEGTELGETYEIEKMEDYRAWLVGLSKPYRVWLLEPSSEIARARAPVAQSPLYIRELWDTLTSTWLNTKEQINVVARFLAEKGFIGREIHDKGDSESVGLEFHTANLEPIRAWFPNATFIHNRMRWDPLATNAATYDPHRHLSQPLPGLMVSELAQAELGGVMAAHLVAEGRRLTKVGELYRAAREASVPANEKCSDGVYDIPGVGPTMVLCGQEGRRRGETWHNIKIGETRYGFNGLRWAKSMRPPQEVLDYLLSVGITVFQADT